MGPSPLPSSAGHEGEEDDPWPFLSPRAPSLAVHWPIALSVHRLGQDTVLEVEQQNKTPHCLDLKQFAEDALKVSKESAPHPEEASGQISI